jgi:hypothetical protein
MRPLPDLADLPVQPSVFTQSKDDFNLAFANEFAGENSLQATADGETPAIFAGMDPISQAIDGLSGSLDAAGSVLDLLSGDLELVNLDPIIENFQAQDLALDSNLSNTTFDFTAGATAILNAILNFGWQILQTVTDWLQALWDFVRSAIAELEDRITEIQTSMS